MLLNLRFDGSHACIFPAHRDARRSCIILDILSLDVQAILIIIDLWLGNSLLLATALSRTSLRVAVGLGVLALALAWG